jgi:UDP-glucose 4,6-dehydratase
VYGPNQFLEKLIPKFILLARGSPSPSMEMDLMCKATLYCEDVVESFEVVLRKGSVGHVYNIGEKKERSVTMDGVKPSRTPRKARFVSPRTSSSS